MGCPNERTLAAVRGARSRAEASADPSPHFAESQKARMIGKPLGPIDRGLDWLRDAIGEGGGRKGSKGKKGGKGGRGGGDLSDGGSGSGGGGGRGGKARAPPGPFPPADTLLPPPPAPLTPPAPTHTRTRPTNPYPQKKGGDVSKTPRGAKLMKEARRDSDDDGSGSDDGLGFGNGRGGGSPLQSDDSRRGGGKKKGPPGKKRKGGRDDFSPSGVDLLDDIGGVRCTQPCTQLAPGVHPGELSVGGRCD